MSHFNLESTITNATRLDVPIERGPLMRWQKKAVEAGVRTLSLSDCKHKMIPDSKVHGANVGPTWVRQDPGVPQVGPMDFAIRDGVMGYCNAFHIPGALWGESNGRLS